MTVETNQTTWNDNFVREVRVNYIASDKYRVKISGPVDIADFVRSVLLDNSREQFVAIFLVHLGLLWVEIKSTAVEVDGCFEVLAIAISSNSPFDRHDLAMDSLGHCIGDS
jgi:hypothetical protein